LIFFFFVLLYAFISYNAVKKFSGREVFYANAINEAPNMWLARIGAALYYAETGMLDKAEEEILLADKLMPNDPRVLGNAGYIFMLEKKYGAAAGFFERALVLSPENDTALYNLSQIYYVSGEAGKALVLAERLIKIHPEVPHYKKYYDKIKNAENEL